MNLRPKRLLGAGAVLALTFGPLGWLGTIAWRMAEHREQLAADSAAIGEMRTEIASTEGSAELDVTQLAAPGGEQALPDDRSLLEVDLAAEENVAAFLGGLEILAVEAGLAALTIDLQPSATVGRTALRVVGRGSLEQVCRFVARVERTRDLTVVEAMDLVGRDDGTIDVTLGIARFHR